MEIYNRQNILLPAFRIIVMSNNNRSRSFTIYSRENLDTVFQFVRRLIYEEIKKNENNYSFFKKKFINHND